MSEHTPEPWVVDQPYIKNATDELTADWVIAESWRDYGIDAQWANARRIVACVNALAGWPTEALEQLAAPLADQIRERGEHMRKLEEALRPMTEGTHWITDAQIEAARKLLGEG